MHCEVWLCVVSVLCDVFVNGIGCVDISVLGLMGVCLL